MRAAKSILAVVALSAITVLPSSAQERPNPDARPVRVQVGISFFMPGSTIEANDEASRVREHARRIVYDMAAKECGLLLNALAGSCRLESVTVNVNRQAGQQLEGFFVNGNMAYAITLK